MTDNTASAEPVKAAPKWRPIPALDRRVLGVLVEKAKTTPDQYPMTLNGLCSGCNQKNNRFPQMDVEPEDVEEALERLRALGAVAEVQGSGRVSKYRHFMYEWLGVEKVELAVMTELLLRGAQTEGELRGRAARMDPIPDLGVLRNLLDSLKRKGLVVSLTPEGRGHVITHALYEARELEKLRAEHGSAEAATAASFAAPAQRPASVATATIAPAPVVPTANVAQPAAAAQLNATTAELTALRDEVRSLRGQVSELRSELSELLSGWKRTADELQSIKDSLGI